MDDLSLRNDDIRDTVEKYRDSILRFAFTYVKNRAEAEDIAQEVFVAYIEKTPLIESEEKKKAWLMQMKAATVGTRLARGRKKLKDMIGEDFYE